METVVVVGTSVAGLAAAETLRSQGYDKQLVLINEEAHRPYDRPPLSKQFLIGHWDTSRITLRGEAELGELRCKWYNGVGAVGVDPDRRVIRLGSGETISFDALIVATGVKPLLLNSDHPAPRGVHTLRTLDDAMHLKAALAENPRVVVVGSGVLGTEFAASARSIGLDVTIVGGEPYPMMRQFGTKIGALILDRIQEAGIQTILAASVADIMQRNGAVTGVILSDGREIGADLVVVAIGSRPTTGWLRESGLDISNGLVCDAYCRAANGIYGAGDIASWWHSGYGRQLRIEHRTHAAEHGRAAAMNVLGAQQAFRPVPFMWSDFFDVKLQSYGIVPADAEIEITKADVETASFTAQVHLNDRLVGVIGWNAARALRGLRPLVEQSFLPPHYANGPGF